MPAHNESHPKKLRKDEWNDSKGKGVRATSKMIPSGSACLNIFLHKGVIGFGVSVLQMQQIFCPNLHMMHDCQSEQHCQKECGDSPLRRF